MDLYAFLPVIEMIYRPFESPDKLMLKELNCGISILKFTTSLPNMSVMVALPDIASEA